MQIAFKLKIMVFPTIGGIFVLFLTMEGALEEPSIIRGANIVTFTSFLYFFLIKVFHLYTVVWIPFCLEASAFPGEMAMNLGMNLP